MSGKRLAVGACPFLKRSGKNKTQKPFRFLILPFLKKLDDWYWKLLDDTGQNSTKLYETGQDWIIVDQIGINWKTLYFIS